MPVRNSRLRLWPLLLTVVALTVPGLGIAAPVWTQSYQPLAFGGASVYPPIASRNHDTTFTQDNITFRQGRPFRIGISVVNNGRFTVRVLSVTGAYIHTFGDLPVSHRRLIVSDPMPKNPLEAARWVRPYRKFRPLDLPPGQVIFLQLNGTFHAPCRRDPGVGESYVLGGFELRYGSPWHTGTAQIRFPANLSIDFPENEDCLGGQPPS